MRPTRLFAICAALLVTESLVGCELIADFDRSKIPVAKMDAATPASTLPSGNKDAGTSDEDAGAVADASSDAH